MPLERKRFNSKRRLRSVPPSPAEQVQLNRLAEQVRYSGNPEHKRNPGDFGLTPPAGARLGKTLCDVSGVFRRADAVALLKQGLRLGLVSEGALDGWPKNIWAMTAEGVPLEAQRESDGTYHGYPLAENDPFRAEVIEAWKRARTS